MPQHYDYRLRVSVKADQIEAITLKYVKGEGNTAMPEAYRVVSALQVFYGTEAAAAAGSKDTRKIALESIGLLLEQCVAVADQGGIDLEALTYDPAILSELVRNALERRDPLRRSRKRKVKVTEEDQIVQATGNGQTMSTPPSPPVDHSQVTTRTVITPTQQEVIEPAPEESQPAPRPKRSRMF